MMDVCTAKMTDKRNPQNPFRELFRSRHLGCHHQKSYDNKGNVNNEESLKETDDLGRSEFAQRGLLICDSYL